MLKKFLYFFCIFLVLLVFARVTTNLFFSNTEKNVILAATLPQSFTYEYPETLLQGIGISTSSLNREICWTNDKSSEWIEYKNGRDLKNLTAVMTQEDQTKGRPSVEIAQGETKCIPAEKGTYTFSMNKVNAITSTIPTKNQSDVFLYDGKTPAVAKLTDKLTDNATLGVRITFFLLYFYLLTGFLTLCDKIPEWDKKINKYWLKFKK